MAGFYYFFKNKTPADLMTGEDLNHNLLAACGLDAVLDDVRKVPAHASVSSVRSNAGPGKSCGVVLTINTVHSGTPHIAGNAPDVQKWIPRLPDESVWVGVVKNELPRPEDLQRFSIIPGYKFADPANYKWHVPVARAVSHGMPFGTLPQSYKFDWHGEPQPVLDGRFQWLWDLAGEIQDYYGDDEAAKRLGHAWLIKAAVRLLAVNYRIGMAEVNLLHEMRHSILTQETVGRIAQASYDFELLEEVKKKSPAEEAAETAAN